MHLHPYCSQIHILYTGSSYCYLLEWFILILVCVRCSMFLHYPHLSTLISVPPLPPQHRRSFTSALHSLQNHTDSTDTCVYLGTRSSSPTSCVRPRLMSASRSWRTSWDTGICTCWRWWGWTSLIPSASRHLWISVIQACEFPGVHLMLLALEAVVPGMSPSVRLPGSLHCALDGNTM